MIHLALVFLTALAPLAAAPEAPLKPGELRLTAQTGPGIGIGENLVPNGGFEVVENGQPKGWTWSARNTQSTFTLVEDARSGKRAVRITNTTAHGPHIYGQVVLDGGLRLTPGETYTLSLYVKSEDPGPAWAGGGDGWWMRLGLARTGGQWRRLTKTFVAREKDTVFPLMVNTDGPTEGFLVDDIKLEKGDHATPFFDPTVAGRPVELVTEVPPLLSCPGDTVTLTAFAHLGTGTAPAPAEVTITDSAGKGVARAVTAEPLRPGLTQLTLAWAPGAEIAERYRLTLAVGQAKEAVGFELFTPARFVAAEELARKQVAALEAALKAADAKRMPAPYARAALAVARRFLTVAAQKRDAGLIPEAVADAEFIGRTCAAQAEATRRVLDGKQPALAVPDPALEGLRIRDGNFWAGDQPVMLVGGLGYGELERELDTYRDYGLNVIGDDFNAFSAFRMVTGDEAFDETAIPKLARNWNRLRDLNLAIAYNPTLHYFPEWALQRYVDITGGDPVDQMPDWSGLGRHAGKRTKVYGGFFPFAIDSPNLRRLVSRYYGKLMPALKEHPAFHVVWLMNEPTYRSKDPHYVELFREYLRGKFEDVAALNAAWGTTYARFEDVGVPAKPDEPARFDWLTFHQDQVAGWFEWLASEAKRHHPRAILSNKPMAWTLLDPEEGIDWEREAELWEIPGCDAGRSPDNSTYAFGWVEAAMLFDFQKSVAPDKPLADHEYHYVHWPNVSSDYVRATYFHSYLHGLRMSQFWVWATGQIGPGKSGAGMQHTAWSQPKVAWGTATSALDLRRLAKTVAAFPGKPEVLLYHSRPSLYLDHGIAKGTLSRAYQAANGLDAPVGFMTDRMIRAGKLQGCKLLVVPGARFVQSDVRDAIADFARKGGRVLFVGEGCLARDEYGREHPGPLGIPEARLSTATGTNAKDLVPAFDQAFTAAGVSRPVRCLNASGGPAWPVECRTATVDGRQVCALVGVNRDPMHVKLTAARPIRAWEDLITGEKGTGDTLEVKPLDVHLLKLE